MNHWGKVMNDELAAIAGRYEDLVGRLQERYGIAKEEAHQQVKDFMKTIEKLKRSNGKLIQWQKTLHDKERTNGKRVSTRSPLRKTSRSKSAV